MKTSHLQKEYHNSAGFGVFENMDKIQKETPKTEKKYSCDQCEYSTGKKSHLKRHVKTHLKTKTPPKQKCDSCEYTSTYSHDVKKHMKICTSKRSKYRKLEKLNKQLNIKKEVFEKKVFDDHN